jgi:hypothetical protein
MFVAVFFDVIEMSNDELVHFDHPILNSCDHFFRILCRGQLISRGAIQTELSTLYIGVAGQGRPSRFKVLLSLCNKLGVFFIAERFILIEEFGIAICDAYLIDFVD